MSDDKLKPCPCGKIPEVLAMVQGSTDRWGYVSGNCCGEWEVEFRTSFHKIDSYECLVEAIKYWNQAPRTKPDNTELIAEIRVFQKRLAPTKLSTMYHSETYEFLSRCTKALEDASNE